MDIKDEVWVTKIDEWILRGYIVREGDGTLLILNRHTVVRVQQKGLLYFEQPVLSAKVVPTWMPDSSIVRVVDGWLAIAEDPVLIMNARRIAEMESRLTSVTLSAAMCARTEEIKMASEQVEVICGFGN